MENKPLAFLLLWLAVLVLAFPGASVRAAPGQQPFVDVPQKEAAAAQQQAKRQEQQPLNNAPVWREVRSGDVGVTQVRGVETGVLVQPAGQTWRALRNGPVTLYGGILVVAVVGVIALLHLWKGPVKLHGEPTGRKIQRFNAWDRVIHWSTAISFVILAITGLVIFFGKHVLLPVTGYTLFSWLAAISKNLHNFVGPWFIASAVLMFFTYVKDNLWKGYDWRWFKSFGGMFGGEHVPSGKFNAGEKAWFWIGLFLFSIAVGVTGLILDFPNFDQGRGTMQLANVIHVIVALLYIALALGHIYMGTIGVEGAYDSMRGDGMVDEAWAKEHHEYWYKEVKAEKGEAPQVGGAQPQQP